MVTINPTLTRRVDEFVERYEASRVSQGSRVLAEFLPPASDPDYTAVAIELVRVDMEYSWQSGGRLGPLSGKQLGDYPAPFADLLNHREAIAELAYEEYRLRLQAGQNVRRSDYARRYGLHTGDWPADAETLDNGSVVTSHSDGTTASLIEDWCPELRRLTEAIQPMPVQGSRFAGFRILDLIGEGAFGRVYLATQDDLAARPVVLKITSGRTSEPQRLARLQHPNIVPVYSIHQQEELHAICMPFLGVTTLADVLKRFRASQRAHKGETAGSSANGKSSVTGKLFSTAIDEVSDLDRQRTAADVGGAPVQPRDQLEQLSYPAACVSVAQGIADGLAFAHRQGIVHRDLKPANILLTDEGDAMLLDFNVAETLVTHGRASLFVGGTLPYMAPEHLRALETGESVDERSDIFAFGVILFQMLTGDCPYPVPANDDELYQLDLQRLITQRTQSAPDLRQRNPDVPADVAAIVCHCLQADIEHRYSSMDQVCEDLRRHSDNLPLRNTPEPSLALRFRKWCRRHPRLISHSSLAGAAAAVVAILAVVLMLQHRAFERQESRRLLNDVEHVLPELRILFSSLQSDSHSRQQGQRQAEGLFAAHGLPALGSDLSDMRTPSKSDYVKSVRSLAGAEQARLRRGLAEICYLRAAGQARQFGPVDLTDTADGELTDDRHYQRAVAMNGLALRLLSDPSLPELVVPAGIARQQRWLNAMGTNPQSPIDAPQSSDTPLNRLPLDANAVQYVDALELLRRGHAQQAIPQLEHLRREHPQDFSLWLLLGDAYLSVGQVAEARAAYNASASLWSESPLVYLHRGIFYLSQSDLEAAIADFDQVLRLRPQHPSAILNRAIARMRRATGTKQNSVQRNELEQAERDLTTSLDLGCRQTRIYFLRAKVRSELGDASGAAQDRQEVMDRTPTDAVSWIVRGNAFLNQDPHFARQCYEAALLLNPSSHDALRNIAHVLAERLNQPSDAVEVVDRLIDQFGGRNEDVISRGVLYARLGNRDGAIADAALVQRNDTDAKTQFQLGCLFALCASDESNPMRADDARRAVQFVGNAIAADRRWLPIAMRDPDLRSLRGDREFRQLIRVAAEFQRTLRSIQKGDLPDDLQPTGDAP